MVYLFIYSVIYIKCDFTKIKLRCNNDSLILVGSEYCLNELTPKNRAAFDEIHQITRDFQQIDHAELDHIVQRYVEKHGAQHVRLLTNEDSAQLGCARLREIYGIPGNGVDHLLPFVHKVISKNRLENCVNLPKYVAFDKKSYANNKDDYLACIISKLGFPMFIKPVDLVSSIETHRVNDLTTLQKIAERILAHSYEFEIDEFIDGDLFHCDTVIINGKIQFFMTGKCSLPLARFFEGIPLGSIPPDNKEEFNQLKQLCAIICKKLKCHDGAYHLEFFLEKKSQRFIFLEIGARTGGSLITKTYEKLFHMNIEEVNYLIQMELVHEINVNTTNLFTGFFIYPHIKGTVTSINKPEIEIAHEFIEYVSVGDELNQASNLLDISCSIIFWDESYQKVKQTFDFLKTSCPVKQRIQ